MCDFVRQGERPGASTRARALLCKLSPKSSWHASYGFWLRDVALLMPITCRECGAVGEHLTVHCPSRAAAAVEETGPKGKGKGGGKLSTYERKVQFAEEADSKQSLIMQCRSELELRDFQRIRLSVVNSAKMRFL